MNRVRKQTEDWGVLYGATRDLLLGFGSEGFRRSSDCWVDDDDIGTRQIKIYVRNLALLRPHVISAIQGLLEGDFSNWEIVLAVSVSGRDESWPDMGLIVRSQEIIDGLQRDYLPQEFRDIQYDGSRPAAAPR
jgi:hypothetical protein